MSHTLTHSGLSVDKQLAEFVKKQLLPGTHLDEHQFWKSFANIVQTLTPLNKSLLAKREQLQKQIDDYHLANKNADQAQYQAFLKDIGYLVDEPENFSIETQNVEPEIALTAGPQLVVPVSNARFALNAANARWGSLYDALYGTDVLSEDETETGYIFILNNFLYTKINGCILETSNKALAFWVIVIIFVC